MRFLLVIFLLISGFSFAQQPEPKNTRTLVEIPKTHGIKTTESCKIVLRLQIDEYGNVLGAELDRSMTTTANMELINQVIAVVKEQTKYSTLPGVPEQTVSLTIRLKSD